MRLATRSVASVFAGVMTAEAVSFRKLTADNYNTATRQLQRTRMASIYSILRHVRV